MRSASKALFRARTADGDGRAGCTSTGSAADFLPPRRTLPQLRGAVLKSDWAPWLLATNHPSAVLRMPDAELRDRARRQFFEDIELVGKTLRAEMKAAKR